MKLRFVKFFTSRENEIEKKEEGGGALPSRALLSTARPQPETTPRSAPALLHHHFHSSSLHPTHQPASHRPACRPPRAGRAIFSSYLLLNYSAPPFLLHKITEAEERGGCRVAEHLLADPASRPSCSGRPARPQACPSRYHACPPRLHLLPSLGAVHPHRSEL